MCATAVFQVIFTKLCLLLLLFQLTCIRSTLAKDMRAEVVNVSLVEKQPMKPRDQTIYTRLEQLKEFRWSVKNCVKRTKDTTWNCFKRSMLQAFDKLTTADVIPIWNGVRFLRSNDTTQNDEIKENTSYQRQDLQHLTWFDALAMRLVKVLHTHVLQLNWKEMTDACMRSLEHRELKTGGANNSETVGTARHRRHRYNMMMTMMFGVTALGAVLVPMGFQLLSVVSGKALLLAKMALLLASINGLKRVANSGVHYGLYQVPGEHYGGYYERNDLHHPRNVANLAVAQPIELGIRK